VAVISEAELESIVGRAFPGGQYTVEPYVDWLVHDVVESSHRGDVAHPIFGFIASLRGKGMSLDELFEICGATAADGPMFGEHETELLRPLEVGETYAVSGEFVSAVRKQGRKTGVFDIVGFRLTLTDSEGRAAATAFNSFVFPRRAA
jgi:hypothetical protein